LRIEDGLRLENQSQQMEGMAGSEDGGGRDDDGGGGVNPRN